jgi:hypothetical protein
MGMSKFTRGRVKVAEALGKGIGEGEGNAPSAGFLPGKGTLPFLAKSSPFPCAHRWLWLYSSRREKFRLCLFSELGSNAWKEYT